MDQPTIAMIMMTREMLPQTILVVEYAVRVSSPWMAEEAVTADRMMARSMLKQ